MPEIYPERVGAAMKGWTLADLKIGAFTEEHREKLREAQRKRWGAPKGYCIVYGQAMPKWLAVAVRPMAEQIATKHGSAHARQWAWQVASAEREREARLGTTDYQESALDELVNTIKARHFQAGYEEGWRAAMAHIRGVLEQTSRALTSPADATHTEG